MSLGDMSRLQAALLAKPTAPGKARRITRLASRAAQILTADSNRDAIVIWASCCAAAVVAVLQISGALQ